MTQRLRPPGIETLEDAVDWVPIKDVPEIVERETGHLPTTQTVYNWVRYGWLQTNGFRPLLTTRKWVLQCLREYLRPANLGGTGRPKKNSGRRRKR